MVISSLKHKITSRSYSLFTFVPSENVFLQGMVVLLNPVCALLSGFFMFISATQALPSSRLDDLCKFVGILVASSLIGSLFYNLMRASI